MKLEGLIAATFTPFDESGKLKLAPISGYTDYLVDSGMRGLYVCGTTGEGVNMTVSERKSVAEAFQDSAKGRIPVVVQVGANSLGDSRELAGHAEKIGAACVSANAPSYFRIEDTGLLAECMSEIAAAAPDTPFYYYHIPALTGVSIDMTEFLLRMEKGCPSFAGIKYTDTKAFQFQEAVAFHDEKYDILWGCDEMLLSGLVVGASGGVGSTYGLVPKLYAELWMSWRSNDIESARKLQLRSWRFVKTFLKHGHSHQAQKAILKMIGFDFGTSRLPIPPLKEGMYSRLQNELTSLGYI